MHEDRVFSVLAAIMPAAKKTAFEMAVIDLVREKRIEKKLSQDLIAAFIGKTRGFVGHVESPANPSKYNLNHLNRIANEMGCSPKDFIPKFAIPEKEDPIRSPKKKSSKKKKR
jgi:transcriptional regulator with XRE-family HTH domain